MVPSSDQDLITEAPKRRGKRFWAGVILSSTPMVICLLVVKALGSGISIVALVFALTACLVVWVPLSVSCVVLRLMSWSRLRAHLGVMFAVTFVPMLTVYKFFDFDPDASLSWHINNSGTQLIEFSVAGVIIAVMVGLINVLCMWIFWLIAVRPSEGLSATN